MPSHETPLRVFELASEPKAALFHPRAGHNDLFEYPEVVERVIAFAREQVSGTAAEPTNMGRDERGTVRLGDHPE